jgi:adenylate kinase
MLNELMQKGQLVSNQIVLDMIKDAMISKLKTSKGFLIDGYPRQVDQGIEFEKQVIQNLFYFYFFISSSKVSAGVELQSPLTEDSRLKQTIYLKNSSVD